MSSSCSSCCKKGLKTLGSGALTGAKGAGRLRLRPLASIPIGRSASSSAGAVPPRTGCESGTMLTDPLCPGSSAHSSNSFGSFVRSSPASSASCCCWPSPDISWLIAVGQPSPSMYLGLPSWKRYSPDPCSLSGRLGAFLKLGRSPGAIAPLPRCRLVALRPLEGSFRCRIGTSTLASTRRRLGVED